MRLQKRQAELGEVYFEKVDWKFYTLAVILVLSAIAIIGEITGFTNYLLTSI